MASTPSTSVTPVAPATAPDPPTSVVATAGNTSASVAFVAPTNNGGSAITGYTVTTNPGGITATGATSPINVTGLTNGTAYTFTVIATNALGNSGASTASTAVTPTNACGSITTVSDGDGNSYQTVGIGTQCWTTTNLKTTKYNDGVTSIPDLTSAGWTTATTGARTEYNAAGVTGYVSTYGYLYNWYAAAGIITTGGSSTKNICPSGWHVPTVDDWNTLTSSCLGTTPGTQLKENSSLWTNNTGTNSSGFSARPAGYRRSNGDFSDINSFTYFWSATPGYGGTEAFFRGLNASNGNVLRTFLEMRGGFSIRCIKD